MKIIEIAALIAAGLGLCAVDSYWHKIAGYVIVGISALATLWVFIPWSRIFRGFLSIFKRKRFLATVMFTDIVGYSTMKEEDEGNAQELLDKCCYNIRPLIEKHHGKWLPYILFKTICESPLSLNPLPPVGARETVELPSFPAPFGGRMFVRKERGHKMLCNLINRKLPKF